MGLSYTEELVSEYFRHLTDEEGRPLYMVSEHVHFQVEETKKGVKGWKDIDILAIGKNEICIIQTKSYAIFEKTVKESIDSAEEYFEEAEKFVAKQYDIKGKKIRKIFIADFGVSKTFQETLSAKGIEVKRLRDVFLEYLNILHKLYPDIYHLGKEENNVTRILMFFSYSFKKELESCGLLKTEKRE
ncbi:MAG: hypothetical protein QXJ31_05450 [Candidatus Bathyarchaeia archaeon]